MDDDLPYLTAEEQLLESLRAHLDNLPRSETLVACQLHALIDKAETLLRFRRKVLGLKPATKP